MELVIEQTNCLQTTSILMCTRIVRDLKQILYGFFGLESRSFEQAGNLYFLKKNFILNLNP